MFEGLQPPGAVSIYIYFIIRYSCSDYSHGDGTVTVGVFTSIVVKYSNVIRSSHLLERYF